MNISSLRARIRSLQRRMARPYAQLMIQRMSYDHCIQWVRVQADKRPTPSPQAFVRRVAKAGFRLPTFTAAVRYLERCASRRGAGPAPPPPRPPPLGLLSPGRHLKISIQTR